MKVKATTAGGSKQSAQQPTADQPISATIDVKSSLFLLQQHTQCTSDQITQLQRLIESILEGVLGVPHEDKTNRIEMLRKIENELRGMAEKREYIAGRPKPTRADPSGTDLEKLENE